jgi:hypothetical protein
MKPNRPKQVRLELERLEERNAPGSLSVTPPAGPIASAASLAVPDAAQPGLHAAQVHTGGVITWFIDPVAGL